MKNELFARSVMVKGSIEGVAEMASYTTGVRGAGREDLPMYRTYGYESGVQTCEEVSVEQRAF